MSEISRLQISNKIINLKAKLNYDGISECVDNSFWSECKSNLFNPLGALAVIGPTAKTIKYGGFKWLPGYVNGLYGSSVKESFLNVLKSGVNANHFETFGKAKMAAQELRCLRLELEKFINPILKTRRANKIGKFGLVTQYNDLTREFQTIINDIKNFEDPKAPVDPSKIRDMYEKCHSKLAQLSQDAKYKDFFDQHGLINRFKKRNFRFNLPTANKNLFLSSTPAATSRANNFLKFGLKALGKGRGKGPIFAQLGFGAAIVASNAALNDATNSGDCLKKDTIRTLKSLIYTGAAYAAGSATATILTSALVGGAAAGAVSGGLGTGIGILAGILGGTIACVVASRYENKLFGYDPYEMDKVGAKNRAVASLVCNDDAYSAGLEDSLLLIAALKKNNKSLDSDILSLKSDMEKKYNEGKEFDYNAIYDAAVKDNPNMKAQLDAIGEQLSIQA